MESLGITRSCIVTNCELWVVVQELISTVMVLPRNTPQCVIGLIFPLLRKHKYANIFCSLKYIDDLMFSHIRICL